MEAEVSGEQTPQGLSILVIEENLDDAGKVSNFLIQPDVDHHGLGDVTLSSTQYLQEAENILESEKVDLVLMGLHLPDGQGRKLVRRISSMFPKIPVVAMTDKDAREAITELLLEGAQDYIRKDTMDGPTLFRSIQYALNKQKLAIELQNQKDELSISHAELATISEIAATEFSAPIDKLRTITEQLEASIFRARSVVETSTTKNSERKQQLLTELSAQMPSAIEMIKDALNDMNHLSNGIRTLSHIDNRKLIFEEVDCQTIVEKLLNAYRNHIESHDIDINLQTLDTVIADALSIQDIFQGIIDNALKYLAPERKGNISITSQRDLTFTTYMVRDNGRGMNEEELSGIFDAFQRGNGVMNISGNGMGMAYVRALVRRHRGIIWFESTPNSGTVCYFTIDNNLSRDDLSPADFYADRA